MVVYSVFKSGLDGETSKIKNLRQAERYLPDNIYTAIEKLPRFQVDFDDAGRRREGRYADLKQAAADRCPRLLGPS